jgi:hypothetical protein
VGLFLGGVGLYLIGYPIMFGKDEDIVDYGERIIDLESNQELKKEAIFSELSEIEYDYQMNKLSKDDYNRLKERLQRLAVEVMKEE